MITEYRGPKGIENVDPKTKMDQADEIAVLKRRVKELSWELEYERTFTEVKRLKRRLKKLDKKLYG